jgi:hypothetical protein
MTNGISDKAGKEKVYLDFLTLRELPDCVVKRPSRREVIGSMHNSLASLRLMGACEWGLRYIPCRQMALDRAIYSLIFL